MRSAVTHQSTEIHSAQFAMLIAPYAGCQTAHPACSLSPSAPTTSAGGACRLHRANSATAVPTCRRPVVSSSTPVESKKEEIVVFRCGTFRQCPITRDPLYMKTLIAVIASLLFAACHSLEIKTIPAADGVPAQRCVHEKVKFVFKFNDVLKCDPITPPPATPSAASPATGG